MAFKISKQDLILKAAIAVVVCSIVVGGIKVDKLFANTAKINISIPDNDIVIKLSDPKNAPLAAVNGCILLDDENILIRISQTQFLAVNLICTHSKCTVELQGNKFVCPCHGCEYDISGKVTQGPANTNLKTWKTIYDPDKGTVTVKM